MNPAESRVLILRASTRTEVSKIAPDTVISDPRFTTSLAILNYPIKLSSPICQPQQTSLKRNLRTAISLTMTIKILKKEEKWATYIS